jgi:hypothetical protein
VDNDRFAVISFEAGINVFFYRMMSLLLQQTTELLVIRCSVFITGVQWGEQGACISGPGAGHGGPGNTLKLAIYLFLEV